jgi:energy-coupling factor transport system permease protein
MKDITLGRYYPGNSIVHRLDARVKFFISLALMVGLFLLSKPIPFIIYAVFTFSVIIMTKIPLKQILLSLKPILFIIVFAFIMNLFS